MATYEGSMVDQPTSDCSNENIDGVFGQTRKLKLLFLRQRQIPAPRALCLREGRNDSHNLQ
jgi:hypothetical protein